MQQNTIRFGAWLGVVSFAMSFVTFPLLTFVGPESTLTLKVIIAVAGVIDTVITAVFLATLGTYLGRNLNIPNMTILFWMLIAATAILTVGGVISTFVALPAIVGAVMVIGGMISYGIVFLLIGLGLMRWKAGGLFGFRNVLGVVALVSGILLLTIIGAIPATVGILAWTIMAAIVLFRASKEIPQARAEERAA